MEKYIFTSESVTEGHPDKICDAVSDAILDACMAEDPMSRVACETAMCTGFALVTGEITTKAVIDYQKIVRDTIREIGYDDSSKGFDADTCAVFVAMDQQSPDIAIKTACEIKQADLFVSQIPYCSTAYSNTIAQVGTFCFLHKCKAGKGCRGFTGPMYLHHSE